MSLDEQIKFMEESLTFMVSPVQHSILTSLKELRGIKKRELEKIKTKNEKR